MRSSPSTPLVTLEGVTKRFGSVVANRNVDFSIAPGEVLALVGENGAGKSTLVNMLCGLLVPDDGRILVDGRPIDLLSPGAAAAVGIGVVHQHFMLVSSVSVLDNVALAMPELGRGRFDRTALAAQVNAVAGRLGFRIDPAARVDRLDVAAQQRVEIVKALMHDIRLLILDEPTAVLGPEDKDNLFSTIRRLRAEGVAIMLITHKLEDIFSVADRAVILRGGAVAAQAEVAALTAAEVVRHMVGTEDGAGAAVIAEGTPSNRAQPSARGRLVCSIRDVSLRRANGSLAVSGLDLDLHAGEIVAVAGVDGNGQSELVYVLAGMAAPDVGQVECLGEHSSGRGWTAARLRSIGVAHVPEDRRRSGIVGPMTLSRNYLLRHADKPGFWRFGLLRRSALEKIVANRLSVFEVRCTGPNDRIETLSGGNQQKLVLARELDGDPQLILAAHPSRGLDIKTIRFVHRLLEERRDAGSTVLLLSSDLDEIVQLADRIMVLAGGRAFGPVRAGEVARSTLGAWIAGHAETAA